MKVFTVYKHESKGYEAVKVGFSWPAFFFSFWWMLVKGFLFSFVFYAAAYVFTGIYSYNSDINAPFSTNDFFVLIIGLILWLYPGFYGNSWLNKKYINKGYIGAKVIPATSKEAAIALAKNEVVENSPPEDINPQDSIQESSEIINERAYSVAYAEIKRYEKDGEIKWIRNPDLWAKAFAESEGDENKQKVIYVKSRTRELDDEYEFESEQDYKKQKNKEIFIVLSIVAIIIILLAIAV